MVVSIGEGGPVEGYVSDIMYLLDFGSLVALGDESSDSGCHCCCI